jgi:hypothetical protein
MSSNSKRRYVVVKDQEGWNVADRLYSKPGRPYMLLPVPYPKKKAIESAAARNANSGSTASIGMNPRQLLFRTHAAAVKYAREHGARKFSVRKLRRAK